MEYVSYHGNPVKFMRRITILSSMGIVMDGYTLTVFSYALLYLIPEMHLSSYEISIMGISSIMGVFVGSVIFGHLADKYGRKSIYLYDLIFVSIFIFITGFSVNYIEFSIFQFLAGIGIGADYPVSSSIQAEYSPQEKRGKYLVFNIFSFSIGSLIFLIVAIPLVLFTGPYAWRYMYIIGAVFPLIVLFSRNSLEETPYWLKEKFGDNALKNLDKKIESETGFHFMGIPELEKGKSKLSDIFSKKYILMTIFVSIAWFSYDVVSYGIWTYSPLIFSTQISSVYTNLYVVFSGMAESVPVFIGFIIAIYYVERIGRRPLLIIGFLGSLIVLISFFFINEFISITFLFTFSAFGLVHFFHNIGPSPMTYDYPVEIFPTRIRASAMGFSTSFSRLGSILAVFSFPFIDALFGLKAIVIYFAAFEFIGLIITILLAPETKNTPLK
ncbi:MFS transporter [Picrophilus oshimae]|uniref:Sugar transporter n=1 Tax=Picrophilus torridus (strain ATCC 700027 / DSM 9790 / JCM 10055 / NBRC 100828 / KAW 2/3) TaxID=1122961 RepID=Q6KZL6_PICTO|nr:MFS transporter [Picrophilus oshimae]AAT43836.1 putative sugar transporter [Picrophilus oshimae DSM 9789]